MHASALYRYNEDSHGSMVSPLCFLLLFFAFCSFPKTPRQVAVRTSHCSRQKTFSHMVLHMWNLPPWVAFNLCEQWCVTHSMAEPCWRVGPAGQLWFFWVYLEQLPFKNRIKCFFCCPCLFMRKSGCYSLYDFFNEKKWYITKKNCSNWNDMKVCPLKSTLEL